MSSFKLKASLLYNKRKPITPANNTNHNHNQEFTVNGMFMIIGGIMPTAISNPPIKKAFALSSIRLKAGAINPGLLFLSLCNGY